MPAFKACGQVINSPDDLKNIPERHWPEVAEALREFLLSLKVDKPMHLASSLTATEITVAVHAVLNSPQDRIAFDVGHQAYAHKVLTGRAEKMKDLRCIDGPSGFLWPEESPHDILVTGHSSTSLSVIAGMAYADMLAGKKDIRYAVVIGDGALTAGVAYEALNTIGQFQLPVTIILNDNDYSIDPTMGAVHLKGGYESLMTAMRIGYRKNINGHDVSMLCEAIRSCASLPMMLHCQTRREILSEPKPAKKGTFTYAVNNYLFDRMAQDDKVVLVTPAMISGAGWGELKRSYPRRVIDVGIAEQHAVAMCAGLVKSGMKPICHLYSSFFQRAVDQFIHDIALEGLPVTFLIDRVGLVGEDGPTHHGMFDLNILLSVPGVRLFFPTTPERTHLALDQAMNELDISVVRYPRDGAFEAKHIHNLSESDHVLVYYGAQGGKVEEIQRELSENNISLDAYAFENTAEINALIQVLTSYKNVIFFEEGYTSFGLSKWVLNIMIKRGLNLPNVLTVGYPHKIIKHGSIERIELSYGLSSSSIIEKVTAFVSK